MKGDNSVGNNFFQKKIKFLVLNTQKNPLCLNSDFYLFSFGRTDYPKLQRLYRKKNEKGHNSMQKQKFKNLRKPFPDIQVKNICAKFQVSTAKDTLLNNGSYNTEIGSAKIYGDNYIL